VPYSIMTNQSQVVTHKDTLATMGVNPKSRAAFAADGPSGERERHEAGQVARYGFCSNSRWSLRRGPRTCELAQKHEPNTRPQR
jgi:hypothetical protein